MKIYYLSALLLAATSVPAATLIAISEEQQQAFGIELATPEPAATALTRRYPAEVGVPNHQLRVVSAPESGMLESLLVAEGERVSAGQALASLRSPQLLQAQSDYLEAKTRLDLARSELARDRKLFSEGIIAERRLLETRARFQEAETGADQRRQRLTLAGMASAEVQALEKGRNLTSTLTVRSPLDGVVLEQMVNTGQALAAADPLYRVAQLQPLWLEIHVPVDRLAGNLEPPAGIFSKSPFEPSAPR